MARKVFICIFLVLISMHLQSMERPGPVAHSQDAKNYKICSRCRNPSWWHRLIRGSCEHYFCNKCGIKNGKEYKGNCMFCLKPLFDFSQFPESIKYEIEAPERIKRTEQSYGHSLIQDAFKRIGGPDDPIANGAPNVSEMFHAYSLLRRAKLEDYYDDEPFDCSVSLDGEQWLNQFWKRLEGAPQSEKDDAVVELNKELQNDKRYHPHWRVRIAAAIKIKANVGECKEVYNGGGIPKYDSPLIRALDADDMPLLSLLLECNVPIVPDDILFYARSKKAAQELVTRGANVRATAWSRHNLLEIVMQQKRYSVDLVGFYISKGLRELPYRDGQTLLHRSLWYHKKSVQGLQKIDALLESMLPQVQLNHLLHVKSTEGTYEGANVFGMLEKFDAVENALFYCYLVKKRDDAKALLEKEGCKVAQIP